MKRIYRIFWIATGISIAVIWGLLFAQPTAAQIGDDGWLPPVNISQSGGTEAPALIIDSDGIFHTIWLDVYGSRFMYSNGDGETWSAPQVVDFPFSYYQAVRYFAADRRGKIHAFWIDAQDNLFYSRVAAANMIKPLAWTPPQLLGRAVFDLSVSVDQNNNLHLAYVRGQSSNDFIAPGIYYQIYRSGATNWEKAITIDQSSYLRTITRLEANIEIAAATNEENSTIYIVWDNPPRRQVLLARSTDTGATWDKLIYVDRPPNAFYTPYQIQVAATGERAIVLWKLQESGGLCMQKYTTTSDNGETWSKQDVLFGNQIGCPRENHIHTQGDDFILFSILNNQAYFLAWDDSEWSLPQPQTEFSNFVDPETNAFIDLQYLQTNLQDGVFYVAGYDQEGSEDIWFTERSIQGAEDWFPQASAWSYPLEFASDTGIMGDTYLVTDSSGRLHAFWNQATSNRYPPQTAVYYSMWDQNEWSHPNPIFGSPRITAAASSVKISPGNVIYIAWKRHETNELFLSWAHADQAYNRDDWISSDPLPVPQPYTISPDIAILNNNNLLLAYAVPLNEGRGIYSTFSTDGGYTWSKIMQVADASKENWAMVEKPQIDTANGHSEIIWGVSSLPPDSVPLAIYSAHSDDWGENWGSHQTVETAFATWYQVVSTHDNNYHRLWLESEDGVQYLWHQYSEDYGETWGAAENILTTNDAIENIAMTVDPTKQLHLIFAAQDIFDRVVFHHWYWNDKKWETGENFTLDADQTIQPDSLSATVTDFGVLGIIYIGKSADEGSETDAYHLNFLMQQIELPDSEAAVSPTITSAPTSPPTTPTITQTPPLETTAPSPPSMEQSSSSASGSPNRSGLKAGSVIVFGVLFITVSIGLFIRYHKKR